MAAGAVAAGAAWLMAHVAKAIADRSRPYEVMADAVLRQQPAHGTSFPSSHTAVTLAVAIALVPFLALLLAVVGIGYATLVGWSRVYLGVHDPLDILGGAGIGMAAGGVILLAAGNAAPPCQRRRLPPPSALAATRPLKGLSRSPTAGARAGASSSRANLAAPVGLADHVLKEFGRASSPRPAAVR